MLTIARLALIGAALVLAASEAAAQFGGGMPGGSAGRRGGARGGSDTDRPARPAQAPSRADTFQTTLEELRIDLKLDAPQQAAWNRYAEKLAALMADLARERNRAMPGVTAAAAANAAQQLDRIALAAQNRATAIEEVTSAGKALYGMLSPEQRNIADVRLANVTSLALP